MSTTIDALIAVRQARADRDETRTQADQHLRDVVRQAAQAGAPQTLIAEAAGVTRETIWRWLS